VGVVGYTDLFPAGLGFDISGAYLLAKGLGMRPEEYTRRFRASRHTFGRANVKAAEDFADAKAGVGSLVGDMVFTAG
jgi:hypothetical protein